MAEPRKDGPRIVYETDAREADSAATVDVMDLLAQLADRTEEVAEATARERHAEATLRSKTREVNSERKAHREALKRLEADYRDLEAERDQVASECHDLEAEIAKEHSARTADEAELERTQHRVAALQHQLQVAWAQLQQGRPEGGQPSWWSRLRP